MIEQDRVLIAKYLGMWVHHQDKGVMVCPNVNGHNEIVPIEDLAYDSDWNALMGAVNVALDEMCDSMADWNREKALKLALISADKATIYYALIRCIKEGLADDEFYIPSSDCCGAETDDTEMGICPDCLEHCEFE